MKSLTSAAIVALTAGIIGVAGIVPAATAQQQPPGQPQQQVQPYGKGHFQMRPPMAFRHGLMGRNQDLRVARGGMRAGLVGLVCSDRGAERMEVAFVRLSYRLGLSAEQKTLFDDLRTAALTAQTEFADACKAARPAASAEGTARDTAAPDPVEGLKARIALDKARVAALESVLPKFEAFYGSLSDAQKARLMPRRDQVRMQGQRPRFPAFPGRPGHGFPGMMQPGMPAPDAPAAPAAPGAAPAAPAAPGDQQT